MLMTETNDRITMHIASALPGSNDNVHHAYDDAATSCASILQTARAVGVAESVRRHTIAWARHYSNTITVGWTHTGVGRTRRNREGRAAVAGAAHTPHRRALLAPRPHPAPTATSLDGTTQVSDRHTTGTNAVGVAGFGRPGNFVTEKTRSEGKPFQSPAAALILREAINPQTPLPPAREPAPASAPGLGLAPATAPAAAHAAAYRIESLDERPTEAQDGTV